MALKSAKESIGVEVLWLERCSDKVGTVFGKKNGGKHERLWRVTEGSVEVVDWSKRAVRCEWLGPID